jgi:hypothetical protein
LTLRLRSPYRVAMSGQSRLARIARIAAKIAAGLLAVVILIVIALFLANSFDVRLSAQAKALLAAPANPFTADQNMYLAMAGLEGPRTRPIVEMGQERIAAYDRALKSMLLSPDIGADIEKKWNSAKLAFDGKLETGAPRSSSIWIYAKTHRQDIAVSLNSNQQLYRRYLSLHPLLGYYETAQPSFMAPVIVLPQQLRALFLADVAARLQSGSPQQQQDSLTDLRQDLQLWRAVLKGDGTLFSKMIAVASLHGDLILAADLIADPKTDLKSLDDVLDSMLVPWDLKDYRIGNAFAAEYRARATLYGTVTAANELVGTSASSSWWTKAANAFQAHFFRPNDTENMDAEFTARRISLNDSTPGEFLRNRKVYEVWLEKEGANPSPSYVFNPVGKILASLSAVQKDTYALRAFDVAAYQRLVYLVFQIKRQRIATADIASFMQAHRDWSTHPVDDETFSWNADSGEIAANSLGDRSKAQRFSIVLR